MSSVSRTDRVMSSSLELVLTQPPNMLSVWAHNPPGSEQTSTSKMKGKKNSVVQSMLPLEAMLISEAPCPRLC